MKKKPTYELTGEGMIDFLQFPDLQSYTDSLSLADLNKWNDKLSGDEVHPETIRTAMAIYLRESGRDRVSLNQDQLAKLCTEFSISIGLALNIRIGHIKILTGRMKLVDSDATFTMTDAGIRHVENNLLKK